MKYTITGIVCLLVLGAFLLVSNQKESDSHPATTAEPDLPATKSKASVSNDARSPRTTSPSSAQREQHSRRVSLNEGLLFDQSSAKLRNNPDDEEKRLPAAVGLEEENLTPTAEIGHVMSLLYSYRTAAGGGYFPTGLNFEITNALLGENKSKIAFISAANTRINSEGELVDQWGTPFFFHNISSSNITVRSAGPDLKMYTQDDSMSAPDN